MSFNPVAMVINAVAIARHGRGREFRYKYKTGGWTNYKITKILSDYGIGVYAPTYPSEGSTATFRVNARQADWAESILRSPEVNCPLEGEAKATPLAEKPATRGGYAKNKDLNAFLQSMMGGRRKPSEVQPPRKPRTRRRRRRR